MNDVVVAGGGLIGLAVAWRCAQRGLSVTVVDEAPGAGASYAAAGMLAPVTEAAYGEERLLALCRESLDRFPGFVTELQSAGGAHIALGTAGTLLIGFDADDMRALVTGRAGGGQDEDRNERWAISPHDSSQEGARQQGRHGGAWVGGTSFIPS